MHEVIITATGAVTSVGLDAITTCASIRAGISRPETLQHAVLDLEEHETVGLTGHPISLVTRGFTGGARWIQMAALALEDLCRSAPLPPVEDASFWSSTICEVVTPLIDVRRFIREEAWATEEAVRTGLLSPLERRVGSFFSMSRSTVRCRGRVGVLEVIGLAAEQLRLRRCERVVVLAVDSLTDGAGLMWLAEHGRLKHDQNPAALVPGEGAVAFMLEDPREAAARRADSLGRVAAVAHTRGAGLGDDDHHPGEALAHVVQTVLTASGVPLPYVGETITDLNGEPWRAKQFGHAQVRVPRSIWDSDAVELPAASVGDSGACMAALEIVLASRSLYRGYATGPHVLLTTSDEYGHVGAAVLSHPLQPPRTLP